MTDETDSCQRSSVAISRLMRCPINLVITFRLLWLHFVSNWAGKNTDMKLTEEQKQKICDYIDKSLNGVTLKYHKTDDEDSLPLVDLLSVGETILEGIEEIENIVDQIFFDMDDWDI